MSATSLTDIQRRNHRGHFIKRAIPAAVRRQVAARAGGKPLQTTDARCHYCGAAGRIHWITQSWVCLDRLEFDHVVPEFLGGPSTVENIVLACRGCNRSKGSKLSPPARGGRIAA